MTTNAITESISIPPEYRPAGDGQFQFAGIIPDASLFSFGRILVTRTAAEEVEPREITRALYQYAVGNWGMVPSAIDDLNAENVRCGGPLIGCYWLGKEPIPVVFVTREDPTVTQVSIW